MHTTTTTAATPFALAIALSTASTADAFQLETAFSEGCHEQLTRGAAAVAGWPGESGAPPESERGVRENLPFGVDDGEDWWTTSLVIGARHNDLHGVEVLDFASFVEVHQSALYQEEHCLRAPEHDGAAGDDAALDACRAYIMSEIERALGDAGDAVDMTESERVDVVLRHQTSALALPRYPFRWDPLESTCRHASLSIL